MDYWAQQAAGIPENRRCNHREAGDTATEAATLSNLGQTAHTLGDYQQALDYSPRRCRYSGRRAISASAAVVLKTSARLTQPRRTQKALNITSRRSPFCGLK